MVNINLICVGDLKEKFFIEAQEEFKKRLSAFCKLTIYEIKEEKNVDNFEIALKKEGEQILNCAKGFKILFDVQGEKINSIEFAQKIEKLTNTDNKISFIIGSSNGVSEQVKKEASLRLSFGDITLPHRLFRIIALEQIYRAFTIIKGMPYHK